MKPNEFRFVALITAASDLANLVHVQQHYNQLIKIGLDMEPYVSNALVDLYAKCGSIKEAQKMFGSTQRRDVVYWGSIISRYAQHGHAEEALLMFERMKTKGIEPNHVTFIVVLSACSHLGLVDSGLCHFNSMFSDFELQPEMEHYACVVALLGRAGKLYEAKYFIEKMPVEPAAIVWQSFLSARRIVGDINLVKYAAEKAISLDPNVVIVCIAFKYFGPGSSWIEINSGVHVFLARDKAHTQAELIYSMLDKLTRQIKRDGYVPDTTVLLDG